MSAILFEDIFELREIDMVGKDPKDPSKKVREKKFDKVSRIMAESESYDTEIHLDVNTEIYPMSEGDKFILALAHTLNANGTPDEDYYHNYEAQEDTLLSRFDYVMHGKIFKYALEKTKAIVYISFGGLLMSLKGEPRTLKPQTFETDSRIYLLLKKQ